jgi:hypothetical protein
VPIVRFSEFHPNIIHNKNPLTESEDFCCLIPKWAQYGQIECNTCTGMLLF